MTLKISRKLDRALRLDDCLQKNQRNVNNFHLNTHQAFRIPLNKSQPQQNSNNHSFSDREEEVDSIKNNNTSSFISDNNNNNNATLNSNENQKSLHYRKFP